MVGGVTKSGTQSRDAPVSILVVDDDEAALQTTVALLATNAEFDVRGVTSAAAVLDALDGGDHLDCIVADHEMPEMSGLDLLTAVRDRDPDIPFIIYTGRGNESIASEAISVGVTDYVRKSVAGTHDLLAARIRSAVARHRAEAERDRRAMAMETVQEGIAVFDDNGRFVEMNEAYADIYGYDREELVGERWELVNPPDECERMELQILPTLEEEGTWRGESVGRRADGSTFAKAKSLTRLDGGGFVCAVRDVTEQKAAEQNLREQNERLREFARLVSHDLRNPLNVAEGYLELLAEEADEEMADSLERVRSAHDRMRRLIDDMLRLAREGRLVDDPDPVSLAAVAASAARTVGLETEGTYVVDEDLPTVLADEERLSALFENLFGNAIEHAGPSPTVRVGVLENDRGICGFFVEDDGPGIPEKQHVRVFESGYTTDRSGTGFGLAIVKRIANAHGWTVSIREGAEGGARFEIRDVDVVETGNSSEQADESDEHESDAVADGGDDDN